MFLKKYWSNLTDPEKVLVILGPAFLIFFILLTQNFAGDFLWDEAPSLKNFEVVSISKDFLINDLGFDKSWENASYSIEKIEKESFVYYFSKNVGRKKYLKLLENSEVFQSAFYYEVNVKNGEEKVYLNVTPSGRVVFFKNNFSENLTNFDSQISYENSLREIQNRFNYKNEKLNSLILEDIDVNYYSLSFLRETKIDNTNFSLPLKYGVLFHNEKLLEFHSYYIEESDLLNDSDVQKVMDIRDLTNIISVILLFIIVPFLFLFSLKHIIANRKNRRFFKISLGIGVIVAILRTIMLFNIDGLNFDNSLIVAIILIIASLLEGLVTFVLLYGGLNASLKYFPEALNVLKEKNSILRIYFDSLLHKFYQPVVLMLPFYIFGLIFGIQFLLYDASFVLGSKALIPEILMVLFIAVSAALNEEAIRLVGIVFFNKFFKNTWISIVLISLLWALLHLNYPLYPFFIKPLALFFTGLYFGWIMKKYGFFQAVLLHLFVDYYVLSASIIKTPIDFVFAILIYLILFIPLIFELVKKSLKKN